MAKTKNVKFSNTRKSQAEFVVMMAIFSGLEEPSLCGECGGVTHCHKDLVFPKAQCVCKDKT